MFMGGGGGKLTPPPAVCPGSDGDRGRRGEISTPSGSGRMDESTRDSWPTDEGGS